MKINLKLVIFLAIILLTTILRMWGLDRFPSGLNADEAAIGYNAYSLIQTGVDEHGEVFPLHFKSFGDYKPGLYFYLVLPFVKFLGLNIWAVRLPSAFLGILSVFGIMLLAMEIFKQKSLLNQYSLIAGFLLAISPWHLQFSRGGWEVNASTTFLLFAIWTLLKGLEDTRYYIPSVILFCCSMYTYHSMRIIVPLLGLGLLILFKENLIKQKKQIVISGNIGFLLLLPLGLSFLSPAGASRFSGVSFLSQTGPTWRVNELRGQHQNWNSPESILLHNKVIIYSLNLMQNYLDHFNGNFLFINGDVIERSKVPETGQMYIYDFLLIIVGLTMIFKTLSRPKIFILIWLLVAPIAAALTFQTPHALRSHNMVIPLVIISTAGFVYLIDWINKRRRTIVILIYCCIVIMLSWSMLRYLHEYYIHYPKTYPAAWEYGFDELVNYLKPIQNNYDKIYVTDKYDQPYILFLFYLQYPPSQFQKEVVLTPRDKFNFSTVRDFANYHFESIDWDNVKDKKNVLVIGTSDEIPNGVNIIKIINFPNGQPAFIITQL